MKPRLVQIDLRETDAASHRNRSANSHLTVEAYRDPSGARLYDARLDLITRAFDLIPVERGSDPDVCVAIRRAFDNAMRLLKQRHVPSA